jgi:hypothetical protein
MTITGVALVAAGALLNSDWLLLVGTLGLFSAALLDATRYFRASRAARGPTP